MSTTQSLPVDPDYRMECVMCDTTIDGHGETAAARYCGAGFCDACLMNRSLSHSEQARSFFTMRAYSFKEHPVLCEINSEVSEVLRFSVGQENDSIALALTKQCGITVLRDCRFDLLCKVIDQIHEAQSLQDIPLTTFKKSRRCDNINTCAGDIVELFRYMSCLTDDVPSCLLSKAAPPSYKNVTAPSKKQPKITDMLNNSLRKPIPKPRRRSPPKSPSPVSAKSSPVPDSRDSPPPPPPPKNNIPATLVTSEQARDSHEFINTESLNLYLNTTPGASMSLGESTWKLYPKTPAPTPDNRTDYPKTPCSTPSNKTFPIEKTPFNLRFRSNRHVGTSSPLNPEAPVFFPPDVSMQPPPAPNCIHESEIACMRDMMNEMQTEIRRLQCELNTYKESVNEVRLRCPQQPSSNDRSTNWAAAEEFIRQVNAVFDKAPATPPPGANGLIQTSPSQPPASPTALDDSINTIPHAVKYVQKEIEWIIGHMAGQDQRLLDLKMEIGNVKQDIPQRARAPPQPTPHAQPAAQFTYIDPSIPTSNRFDILTAEDMLTAEDAGIYDNPNDLLHTRGTSSSAPKSAPRPRPVPRPRPAPQDRPAPTGDIPATNTKPAPTGEKPVPKPRPRNRRLRRPRVKTVGSSMVAQQAKHQSARGLDAECHAHSGERAEQIQEHILFDTSDDDEYIVCAGGTNNVPKESVARIIGHIDDLINHTRALRPSAHILVPQLLHRYNSKNFSAHNVKADKVNVFLEHKCTKDPMLTLNNISRDDLYDKLHMGYAGKDKYAEAVAEMVFKIEAGMV